MSVKPLSQRIWGGEYGFGRESVISKARSRYLDSLKRGESVTSAFVAYASTLYSVANGCFVRGPLYWPYGVYAFVSLYMLLSARLPKYFLTHHIPESWTVDQCETMAAILLALSEREPLPGRARNQFCEQARTFVERGYLLAVAGTSAHTLSFLYQHGVRLHLNGMRLPKEGPDVLQRLDKAILHADAATDANQQSRCYRGIAELYYRLGKSVKAKFSMDKADAVPGISRSVREKNAAARKQMRL